MPFRRLRVHAQVESEGLPEEGQDRRQIESEDVIVVLGGGGGRGAVASGKPEPPGEGKGTVKAT